MREVSLFSPFLSLITRERKEEKLSQSLSRLPPFDEIYRRVRGFISLTSRTSERERDIHCKPLESWTRILLTIGFACNLCLFDCRCHVFAPVFHSRSIYICIFSSISFTHSTLFYSSFSHWLTHLNQQPTSWWTCLDCETNFGNIIRSIYFPFGMNLRTNKRSFSTKICLPFTSKKCPKFFVRASSPLMLFLKNLCWNHFLKKCMKVSFDLRIQHWLITGMRVSFI